MIDLRQQATEFAGLFVIMALRQHPPGDGNLAHAVGIAGIGGGRLLRPGNILHGDRLFGNPAAAEDHYRCVDAMLLLEHFRLQ